MSVESKGTCLAPVFSAFKLLAQFLPVDSVVGAAWGGWLSLLAVVLVCLLAPSLACSRGSLPHDVTDPSLTPNSSQKFNLQQLFANPSTPKISTTDTNLGEYDLYTLSLQDLA